jgi:hypothetical protein
MELVLTVVRRVVIVSAISQKMFILASLKRKPTSLFALFVLNVVFRIGRCQDTAIFVFHFIVVML